MSVSGVSTGYWWVQRPDGAGRQIVRVSGDEGDEAAQIVEYVGGGFWSVRMTRSRRWRNCDEVQCH